MRKSLAVIVLSIFWSCVLKAQTNAISGIAFMNDSITTLQGVVVRIEGSNWGDVSNGAGKFTIKDIAPGNYMLEASVIGYEPISVPILIQFGSGNNVNLYLTESISRVNEVLILAKGVTGLKEIPGSVFYVTPKELQKFNYTDINRALRQAPGINIQEEDGFGLRPNIGLRGTGVERSSKITIMEDGILMAPAPYADPSAYYFPTMGRMQAIEVSKGSSQIKYGPFTTGGAINLISTTIPEELSARVNLWGGSYGGKNLHAYAGNTHEHIGYLIETFQYGSDGFKELDGGGDTGFNKEDYLARLRFQTREDADVYQSISFKAAQVTENSNETYLGLTQEDFDQSPLRRYAGSQKDVITTKQQQFSATHFLRIKNNFSITTTGYRTEFKRNWYKLDKVKDSTDTKSSIATILNNPEDYLAAYDIIRGIAESGTNVLYVKANNRSYYSKGIQTQAHYQFNTGKINHDIEAGVRLHQDEVDRFQWEDQYTMNSGVMQLIASGIPGTESNRINSAKALAAWTQYKLKWSSWTFTPGLRYENISLQSKDFGISDVERTGSALVVSENKVAIFIPGIGIDYQFNKFASLFAGVHKGFSPPGPKDETKPEQSINYELGGRYTKNAVSGQLTLFVNDYSNLLGSDLAASGGTGSGDLFNAGKVLTRGLEFTCGYDLLSQGKQDAWSLPFTIAYTYTDAEFKNSFSSTFADWSQVAQGDQFPYLAKNQVAVGLGLEHKKFGLNFNAKYMDQMRTAPGSGEIPSEYLLPAYMVLDGSFTYNAHKNISFFASATNITNETYLVARRPSGLRPGMPAAFLVGMKAQF